MRASRRATGIISIKDLADSSFSLEDTGGKKGYMNNIIGEGGSFRI